MSSATLAQWRATRGDWCPGYEVPAHVASDLTVDHVEAGTINDGVAVLCRSCNGRKGNR